MTHDRADAPADEGFHVGSLSWPELARRAPGTIGLLPVGAACKEHGRHLPLATDAIQARWIAHTVASSRAALVWPLVGYGHYPAFTAYPGSPSIDEDAFVHTLMRALDALSRSGHRRMMVINTGISTIAGVDAACAETPGATPCHVYAGPLFRAAVTALSEQSGGGHADEVETSLMLHIAPAKVELSRAADASATRFEPGPLNPHAPDAPNYSPDGVMGNPRLASADKGRRLAAALIEDVLATADTLAGAG